MVDGQRNVGAVVGEDVLQPVRQFDIAISGALGVAQRLHEGVIAYAVQFSRYRFEADVAHDVLRLFPSFSRQHLPAVPSG